MHRCVFIAALCFAVAAFIYLRSEAVQPAAPPPVVAPPARPAIVPQAPAQPAAPAPAQPPAFGPAQPAAPAPAQPPAFGPAVPPVPPAPPQAPAVFGGRAGVSPPPPSDRIWEEPAYGQTRNDAEQVALGLARDSVEDFLNRRFHDIGWKPSSEDLLQLGVVRIDVQPPEPKLEGPRKESFLATAHIDVSDQNLRKMQVKVDEARRARLEPAVTQRHLLVGRVLGSFLALFLVVFGYIKLEELTRGYYTTLLRLGAGAVVLLAVLGLFLAF